MMGVEDGRPRLVCDGPARPQDVARPLLILTHDEVVIERDPRPDAPADRRAHVREEHVVQPEGRSRCPRLPVRRGWIDSRQRERLVDVRLVRKLATVDTGHQGIGEWLEETLRRSSPTGMASWVR